MVGLGGGPKVSIVVVTTVVPMSTRNKGTVSRDKRLDIKRKMKNMDIHPNTKKESLNKQVKELHIDTNTEGTGRIGHRAL